MKQGAAACAATPIAKASAGRTGVRATRLSSRASVKSLAGEG